MKIAIFVNGRAHESGVTTYINTIVGPLRDAGNHVDVISLLGITPTRPIRAEATRKTDRLLSRRPFLTLLAYLVSKSILSIHLWRGWFQNRYDIIYSLDASATLSASLLSRLAGIPIVQRVGASIALDLVAQGKLPAGHPLLAYFRNQESRAFNRADLMIPNSSWSRDHIQSLAPQAKLSEMMISPVNASRFQGANSTVAERKRQNNLPDQAHVLFFPSRIDARKGPFVAIEALEKLNAPNKETYILVMAGRGRLSQSVEQAITERGLGDHVRLLGGVPHDEMAGWYQLATATLLCSIPDADYPEPLANCILESFATGTPVIASRTGGIPDVVHDGETGLLIEPGDPTALAEAVKRLLAEPSLRDKIASQAQSFVMETCRPESVAAELMRRFSSL